MSRSAPASGASALYAPPVEWWSEWSGWRVPGDEELVDVEVSGRESGFAEGEVEIPCPVECLIEAEFGYRGPVPVEAGPPQGQGGAVVGAERAAVSHAQAGAGQGVLDPGEGRDEPAGEDVLVYPRIRSIFLRGASASAPSPAITRPSSAAGKRAEE